MRALGVAALLLATLQVGRAEVLGGGLARSDCRMVFGGVTATNGRSGVVCTDGDPACDDDGVADGTCRFAVNVCTGRPTPACDTASFSAISVAGLRLEPPRVPAPDGTCGRKLGVEVPSGTAAGATALALDGTALRDVDYLDLCCVAGVPTPLDAARCAVETALRVSGCPASKIARGARLAFTRAHELVTEFIRAGYAWVGVSAQIVGVEGGVALVPIVSLPLKTHLIRGSLLRRRRRARRRQAETERSRRGNDG